MGWVTDDGQHEGYLAVLLVDGKVASGSNFHGPVVMEVDEQGNFVRDVQYSDDQIVGWELRCDCNIPARYDEFTFRSSTWFGPRVERVATAALEDLAAARIYSLAGDAGYVSDREDVERVYRGLWEAEHLAPLQALTEIERLQRRIAGDTALLAQAVVFARATGRSWEEIGRAAGMTRQSAHERWG